MMGCFGDVGKAIGGIAGIAAPVVSAINPIAGAITGVAGGLLSASHADEPINDAVDAQVKAANDANTTQWEMYKQNRADMEPWRVTGGNALEELWRKVQKGPGSFRESPGYNFAFNQGVNALDRSAAARGRLNSGAHDKALTRYGQGIANQEYDNFLARYYQSLTPYQSLAGVGQTTANTLANMGQNTANQVAQNQINAGDARASGYIGAGNASSNVLNDVAKTVGGINWRNLFAPSTPQVNFSQPASTTGINYSSLWG